MKQIICDLCKRVCDGHAVGITLHGNGPSADVCGECVEAIVAKAIPHCYRCDNCGRFINLETTRHAEGCNWVWGRRGWQPHGVYDG